MNTFLSREEVGAIGFKSVGNNVFIGRTALFYNPERVEIGSNVRIDDYCTIGGRVTIGSFVHVAHFCGLYGGESGIVLEDFSGLSSRCCVYATSDDYSGESMTNPMVEMSFKPKSQDKPVFIGRHVIVGTGSVILPGVSLHEGCSVGAMSLVTRDLTPWTMNGGIPCKVIRPRSKMLLELERQFMEWNSKSCEKDARVCGEENVSVPTKKAEPNMVNLGNRGGDSPLIKKL